jgi:hypothetical protein
MQVGPWAALELQFELREREPPDCHERRTKGEVMTEIRDERVGEANEIPEQSGQVVWETIREVLADVFRARGGEVDARNVADGGGGSVISGSTSEIARRKAASMFSKTFSSPSRSRKSDLIR